MSTKEKTTPRKRGAPRGPKWGEAQDDQLRDLLEKGEIDDSKENDNTYLWKKSVEYFPNYSRKEQRQNAIKRLRLKLRQWKVDKTLTGARKKKAEQKAKKQGEIGTLCLNGRVCSQLSRAFLEIRKPQGRK